MKVSYLDTLDTIVETLLKDETIKEAIQNLKMKIRDSEEPFIWSVIDSFQQNLPSNIKSIWIFVADHWEDLKMFDSPNLSKEDIWLVIDEKTPHEFFRKRRIW
jgi:hypothetical protein